MLNIEVIKFEAQDVITASGVKCICKTGEFGCDHGQGNPNAVHKIYNLDGWEPDPNDPDQEPPYKVCPADKHDCPTYPEYGPK